jgi:hypothetical protein
MALPLSLCSPKARRRPSGTTTVNTLSDIRNSARRHLYGKAGQGVSNPASHFLPMGHTDVLFTALRHVIYQIEPTSATPIATVIREELTDAQMYSLLADTHITPPIVRPRRTVETHNRKPSTTSEQRIIRADALKKIMVEARNKHARQLLSYGHRDVDIIYKCSRYQVEPFRSDKEKLQALVCF